MKNPFQKTLEYCALVSGVLLGVSASAQSLHFQPFAPTPTTNDLYNFVGSPTDSGNCNDGGSYADGAANDAFTYVANGRANMGQLFTTGSNPAGYHVAAIWIRAVGYTANTALTWYNFAADSNPTFTFRLTDPSQVNTPGFALDTESVSVTGQENYNPDPTGVENSANGTGVWLRFGFSSAGTNILLQPNTQYGFDVMGSDADFFETLGTTNNVYSGGQAYIGTATSGTPDDTTNLLVGDRVFLVEMVGDNWSPTIIAPSITNQPANAIALQGASGTFTVGVSGAGPFAYQWYYNTNTLLIGQTNATLSVAAGPNTLGGYSVVVTNIAGSATSDVAHLSYVLPSLTTNLNFTTGGGSILDANGVSTPFSVRLGGTGAAIPTDDPYLLMTGGALDFTSPTFDFNGQLAMDQADAIGINLASVGFNGTQNFTVTATFTNLAAYADYDQVGIFAGTSSTNFTRGGLIFNSNFANLSSYGVATQGSNDLGIATGPAPSGQMTATISRLNGVWSMDVNGANVTPNYSLNFLNSETNLTAGVFALNTAGVPNTTTVSGFSVSFFPSPKLSIAAAGGDLKLNWNIVGGGLESSTNLSDPKGWKSVPGTSATNQLLIPRPASGSAFYRIKP